MAQQQKPNKPRFGRPIFKPFTYNGHQYVQAGDGRWHHASTEVINGQVVFKPGIPVTDTLQLEITESRLPGGAKAPKGPDILAPRPNPLPVQKKPIIPRKPLTPSDFEKLLGDPKSKALRHLFNIRDEQKAKQKLIQKRLDMLPLKDFRKRYQAVKQFSTADQLKALFRVITNQTPKDIKAKSRETKQEVMQERRIEKVPGEDVNTGPQGVIVKIEKNTDQTVRYLAQLIKHFKIREDADAVAADFEQEKRDDEKLFEDKLLQKLDKNGKPIPANANTPPTKADKDMGWLEKAFGIGLEGLEIGLVAGLAGAFVPVLVALGIVGAAVVAGILLRQAPYKDWEDATKRGGIRGQEAMLRSMKAVIDDPKKSRAEKKAAQDFIDTHHPRYQRGSYGNPNMQKDWLEKTEDWLGLNPETANKPAKPGMPGFLAQTPIPMNQPKPAGPNAVKLAPPPNDDTPDAPDSSAPIGKLPPNYKYDAQVTPPNPAVTDLANMLSNDPKLPGGFKQVTATEDSYHKTHMGPRNVHNRGLAMDFTLKDGSKSEETAAYLRNMLASMGINAYVLNEYRYKSPGQTAPHMHVNFRTPADALKFETYYRSIKTVPRNTGNIVVASAQETPTATGTGGGAATMPPVVINKSSNNTVKKPPKRKPTPPTGNAYNTDPTFWNSVVGNV